uniref:Reverse transcriptase domain-containing protein n=1 Tax=Scleropages formosus TaxID=113540 RepID=A0A8C9VFB8_SCLFO
MAPKMAAVLHAPAQQYSFLFVLTILAFYLLLLVVEVGSLITYDRDTLIRIGHSVAHRNSDFNFLNADALFTNRAEPSLWETRRHRRKRSRRRGKRAGVLVRLRQRAFRPPLPTILLANVQSLENKLGELGVRISYQRETRDCCVICLTETWLSGEVPNSAIEPAGFSAHRADRTRELSGKSRGGGVCFMVNNSWCDRRNIHLIKSFCSPDLEYLMLLCRPYWLPREFTAVIITAVYIPPQADTEQALKELYGRIGEQETAHPEAAIIVTGDFNKADLRTIAPKLHQHVTCNTREDRVLDRCYTPFPNGYKSLPRPPFGKSDHCSVLLLPAYRQKLKRGAPALRTIRCWSDQSDSVLQDCFDHVDWEMFRSASDGDVDAYADTVTCFIRKCIDDVVPTKTIRDYPNQKPWFNSEVRAALRARTSAFSSGSVQEYKQASYALRSTIRSAKHKYRVKVEGYFTTNNARSLWQGLNNITDFKKENNHPPDTAASLPDELNTFYARFEAGNSTSSTERAPAAAEVSPLSVSIADVARSFRRVNTRKAAGPDGIPGRVLRVCAVQLAGVFTDIFNLSLSHSVVPLCFKTSTIVPVPKQSKITCLNDWRPVALTSIVSKCLERLIRDYICSLLPASLDPLQFAYRNNRSTDDAIAFTLHTVLSHLEKKNTYVRMLFIDYSSAFNTIVPSKLSVKLRTLGLNNSLCSWILDFLTGRRQVVRMGRNISSPLTLNTGAPQGCVLSPLLYSLYTHDCVATHSSNAIVKFADDTTVVGLITDSDEAAYREEVHTLTHWCQENHLLLNTTKTKEIIVDFRRQEREHTPITISGSPVERVTSFKFLGVHITEDLTWTTHTNAVVKKAHQRLFFLRRLRKLRMNQKILKTFYTCAVESIITGCITSWYGNSTGLNRRSLQRVVRTARHIVGVELPSLQEIYNRRCVRKAQRIINDPSHPSHGLFHLLPSGRRHRSIRARTSRLRDSFFPQAIRLLNTQGKD